MSPDKEKIHTVALMAMQLLPDIGEPANQQCQEEAVRVAIDLYHLVEAKV